LVPRLVSRLLNKWSVSGSQKPVPAWFALARSATPRLAKLPRSFDCARRRSLRWGWHTGGWPLQRL